MTSPQCINKLQNLKDRVLQIILSDNQEEKLEENTKDLEGLLEEIEKNQSFFLTDAKVANSNFMRMTETIFDNFTLNQGSPLENSPLHTNREENINKL